jgi:L-ascorbate metabolism protein UlaG (beta-lactamase superfamily)
MIPVAGPVAPFVSSVDEYRHQFAVSVLGGPTTVVDVAGRRFVIDPTFDAPGPHSHLMKTAGPAVPASALGAVDAVLISHDEHLDNLDEAGRRFARSVPLVVTHPGAAPRLGPPAKGLAAWETLELPERGDAGAITVQAVPAVHGPADGDRDGGAHVTCEVTGFILAGDGIPTTYLSGDNASLGAVAAIADRCGPIDVAVLFVGAARIPARQNGRPLTLTSARAAAAAEVLDAKIVIPAHADGWLHFTEGVDDIVAAFDDAGISEVLKTAPLGQWIVPAVERPR